jgi:16S rRNA processing protein RimM
VAENGSRDDAVRGLQNPGLDWASMVTVGRIIRPHHNRGHVVVVPETDFPHERFAVGSVLYRERDGRPEPIVVSANRERDGRWVVGFEGFDDINAAETLRGLELKIAESDVTPLEAGAYYTFQLTGCDVRTTAGQAVGRVVRVDLDAGSPLLIVGEKEDVLVPFTSRICTRVDIESRIIEIDPPEGLIDLNRRERR